MSRPSMLDAGLCEAGFLVPFVQRRQVITVPQYHWKCRERGNGPFVIVPWTQAGVSVFANGNGRFRVPTGHAFVTVIPEQASYSYPPESREPWTVSWLNFYGDLACGLFQKFRTEFGSDMPQAPRNAAVHLRRLPARESHLKPSERLRTLAAYLRGLRVREAGQWLRETDLPLREVAMRPGFYSERHLVRAFPRGHR